MVQAQYYVSEKSPASIQWKQINTENFQVIYPKEFSTQAQRVTNLLEHAYEYTIHTLQRKPKKVSLVIHNQNAVSNGMALWAPKRMEWYATPPRDIYAQDWYEQLAIHEYRHIIQIDKLNQGLTKLFTYLFGQQATAAVLGLYVPLWFLEGDAVLTETLLSESGRGRIPEFNKDIRAQVVEKEMYSYDKAVFGSFKDYVPNHYKLGYLLVSEGRKDYGAKLWEKTLDKIAQTPYSINPFSRSLKQQTGFHKVDFYEKTLDSLKKDWEESLGQQKVDSFDYQSEPVKNDFVNYYYPHFTDNERIIALKTSFDYTPGIVTIQQRWAKETKLTKPGIMPDYHFSFANNKMCWSELKYDKRWGMKSTTTIHCLDIETGKESSIKTKGRYYTPSISNDGKVAAVSYTNDGLYQIEIFKAPDKKREKLTTLKIIKTAENCLLLDPSWNASSNQLVFIKLNKNKGKSLVIYDLKEEKYIQLTSASFQEISQPLFYKDYIIFNASYSGVDNFYATHIKSKKLFQLTHSKYGCKFASISGDTLCFSDFTAEGYQIASTQIKFDHPFSLDQTKNVYTTIDSAILKQEKGVIEFNESEFIRYEEGKYSKFWNLFNFHSWAPLYINTDDYDANPGISFFSQNTLSTAITTLGYEWDMNERRGIYRGAFTYKGWFPEFATEVNYTTRNANYTDTASNITERIYWDETSASFNISVPLNWNNGESLFAIYPSLRSSLYKNSNLSRSDLNFELDQYQTLEYRLLLANYKRKAKRDLYPKFGQYLEFNYRHTPFGNYNLGSVYSLESRFMFPGILKHNHIILHTGFQRKFSTSEFGFSNLISYPRGYTDVLEQSFYYAYTNYALPLCYPDMSIGGFTYIKRLKANVFYDYGVNISGKPYGSMGVDFLLDTHLLRFIAPIEMGIRNVYLQRSKEYVFQFLFSVNFYDI